MRAFNYLARYVSGAAISDARWVAHADGGVMFRATNYRQGRKRMTLRPAGVEFMRRFALHILPPSFARVRRCGLLANRSKKGARRRELFPVAQATSSPPAAVTGSEPLSTGTPNATPRCAHC